jgi:hypothetical protein
MAQLSPHMLSLLRYIAAPKGKMNPARMDNPDYPRSPGPATFDALRRRGLIERVNGPTPDWAPTGYYLTTEGKAAVGGDYTVIIIQCRHCDGRGRVIVSALPVVVETCTYCGGTGKMEA